MCRCTITNIPFLSCYTFSPTFAVCIISSFLHFLPTVFFFCFTTTSVPLPVTLLLPPVTSQVHRITSSNMGDSEKEQMMRKAFAMFDQGKTGFIESGKISTILNTIGHTFDEEELEALIEEHDVDNSGKLNFDAFSEIAGHFMEEEDAEAMMEELKEAFRLYDREGNGYITTGTLREILKALDDKLGPDDLDGIIAEIDTDGSGTVDFDEFMEMMTGE